MFEDKKTARTLASYMYSAEVAKILLMHTLILRYHVYSIKRKDDFDNYFMQEGKRELRSWLSQPSADLFERLHSASEWEKVLYELQFSRIFELFENYLKDCLVLVYRNDKRTLTSRKTITVENILQFDNMEECIMHLINERVNEISYAGLDKLASSLTDLGVTWPVTEEEWQIIKECAKIRNEAVRKNVLSDYQEIPNLLNRNIRKMEDKFLSIDNMIEFFCIIVNKIDREIIAKWNVLGILSEHIKSRLPQA